MKSLKFCLGACAILAAGAVGAAGSVVEFDTTNTGDGIMWNDLSNWKVGGEQSPALPSSADAAKFTLNGAELTVNFPESTDITLANLWIYGPGKLTFKMPATSSIYIPTSENRAGEVSPGAGRTAMVVRDGAILVLDGGAISNATTDAKVYNHLQMNGAGTRLYAVNGAKFSFSTRTPAKGQASATTDAGSDIEFHVSGEGSEMTLTGQIGGTRSRIYAENGARLLKVPAATGDPVDLVLFVTNKATTANILFSNGGRTVFDDTLYDKPSEEIKPTNSNFSWEIIRSTVNLLSLYWGYRDCMAMKISLKDSTLTTTKYDQMGGGADSGGAWHPSKDMQITVGEGSVYHATPKTSKKTFDIGNYSTNDVFFVDGGTALIELVATFCKTSSSNSVLRVRGETAKVEFTSSLTFNPGAKLECELPLPKDRAAISCAGKVTLADDTKLVVTVPDDFSQKVTHTLLTGSSIVNTIAPENVVVNGKATATVEKSADGKSILLTVKPLSGLMLLIR